MRKERYGADSLAFLIPTSITRVGSGWFSAVRATFSGNLAEDGVYIGVPLTLILARYGATRFRSAATRVLVAMLATVVLLMLGSHLHIAGHPTIPLPWILVGRLPLLDEVVPVRFGVYLFLILALILSMWLGQARSGRLGVAKWSLAAFAIALLVPNVGAGMWLSRPRNPAFFADAEYRTVLRPSETVLALPFGYIGDCMLWQAETGMRFRMAGGHLGPLFPANYVLPAFVDPRIVPKALDLQAFLDRRHVDAVIVDAANPQRWPGALAALGLRPVALGGALIYRVRLAPASAS